MAITLKENFDIGQSIFLPRELESIDKRIYEVLHQPMSATRLIPVAARASIGDHKYTYYMEELTGMAQIVANGADDLPIANAFKTQYSSTIVQIAIATIYTERDLYAQRAKGIPVESTLMDAAVQGVRRRINQLAFTGDVSSGTTGWLTNPDINKAVVPNGAAGTATWATKTNDEIIKDLNDIINYIIQSTNTVEIPTHIAMSVGPWQIINSMRVNELSTQSILQFISSSRGITIEQAPELNGAFTGGTDGMIAYVKDEVKFWLELTKPFDIKPVQREKLNYLIPVDALCGGTIVRYPMSQAFRYGI
jgi:hypothetical protein